MFAQTVARALCRHDSSSVMYVSIICYIHRKLERNLNLLKRRGNIGLSQLCRR